MDTLRDRLAELADDAPTGGVPAADLWARGKRAHRLRAAGLAATLLVAGAVGTGIGVRLADGGDNRSDLAPVGTLGISLPIEYPVGEELPDLGDTPGPLAAIWLDSRVGGGAPEAVGLVADTGMFGTLPIDVSLDAEAPNAGVALSPDGRRIAYEDPTGMLIVRDLVSGQNYSSGSEFTTRPGYTWIDQATIIGRVVGEGGLDGWVWEQGTSFRLVDRAKYAEKRSLNLIWYAMSRDVGPGTMDWWVADAGGGPRSCSSPIIETGGRRLEVPVLCDILVIGGNDLWGHWNSDRLQGDWENPDDGNGTVVVLAPAAPFFVPGYPHEATDPRVVVTAGAPERATFATDLIREALDAGGGAS
jgi:hypothetical protein